MESIYHILISLFGLAAVVLGLQIYLHKHKLDKPNDEPTQYVDNKQENQKEYIDRDLYPRKHGRVAKDNHHGYYHTVPQETVLYHQFIGMIDHKELFEICNVQQSGNEYTDYINLKARMCNSILQIHNLFENQMFLHLDSFLHEQYKQILDACGERIKYVEAQNQFTGDFTEDALKQMLKIGCNLYDYQNQKKQQNKSQKPSQQDQKKNE